MTDFDELLDEVVQEFGSKKGEQTEVRTDSEVRNGSEIKEVKNDSAQSKDIRQVEVSRKDSGGQGTSTENTNGEVVQGIQHGGVYQSRKQEKTSLERVSPNQVRTYEGNAKDGVDRREDRGIENDVEWLPVGEMPTKVIKKRINLTNARRKDVKVQDFSDMLGWGLDTYARDRKAARDVFNAKNVGKPYWAVVGCVLLRDQGICQVCGDRIRRKFRVVQIVSSKLGGSFSEGNCFTLCGECKTCWRSSYTPKYLKHGMSTLGLVKQKLNVLKRRINEFRGCKPLNAPGLMIRQLLLKERERLETELEEKGKQALIRLKHGDVQSQRFI